MNVNDLTSLQSCKDYLGIKNANSDLILSRLITAESRSFLSLTQRTTFAPTTVARIFDGTGTDILMVPDFPLIDVASLVVDGTTVPLLTTAQPSAGAGFYFDSDGRITLVGASFSKIGGGYIGGPWGGSAGGFWFTRARKNVAITYTFGFDAVPVTDEMQQIPTVAPFGVTLNNAFWLSDVGVKYFTSGTPLTRVYTAPNVGEYFVNTQSGLYSFNVADANTAVLISYTYSGVPEDVQQCVNAMVDYVYGNRGSMGVQTEAISGAASTNRVLQYPKFIMQTIYYYRRHYRGPSS